MTPTSELTATLLIMIIASMEANRSVKNVRRKRRWSVRPIFRLRQKEGLFNNIFRNMKRLEPDQFLHFTRMDIQTFYKLLSLLKHKLLKRITKTTLTPEHRLVLTLYYLAHGCSMEVLSCTFLLGKTTVSAVIQETCRAIWDVLSEMYLKCPTEKDWQKISKEFDEKWNLPHCCGAIDGKHVHIQAPKNSGSEYFNYKRTFSIVLMAVCDAHYRFTLVDIGAFGSQSDGGIFRESAFGKALDSGSIKLPEEKKLPGSNVECTHFFVGDEAFPLKGYLLRPSPGKNLDISKKIYNYRLSRARRTIENAFGILASRWRIFRNHINTDIELAELIIGASICLHNFLCTEDLGKSNNTSTKTYCPQNYADMCINDGLVIPGSWRLDLESDFGRIGRIGSNSSSRTNINVRDKLKQYLNNEGAVPWQLDYVTRRSKPNEDN